MEHLSSLLAKDLLPILGPKTSNPAEFKVVEGGIINSPNQTDVKMSHSDFHPLVPFLSSGTQSHKMASNSSI